MGGHMTFTKSEGTLKNSRILNLLSTNAPFEKISLRRHPFRQKMKAV
jgi:hypothetical protein